MNRALVAFALVLATLGTALPTASALSRSASSHYTLATGVGASGLDACEEDGDPVVSAVCFHMFRHERHATVNVRDQSTRSIAVHYTFYRDGASVASGYFCNSAASLQVPPGGADALVLAMGDSGKIDQDLPGCHFQRGVGGVVNAVFR